MTKKNEPSQADLLVGLAVQHSALFRNQYNEAHAQVHISGHLEVLSCKSKLFKLWLSQLFYKIYQKVPNSDSLGSAINMLSGKAIFEGTSNELHNRVTFTEGRLYYDLADREWRQVEMSPGRWEVKKDCGILFRRYAHQQAQVTPVNDPTFKWKELFKLINIKEADKLLFAVWLCLAFVEHIAHPIPIIHGEKGSAKTTAAKLIRMIVDPSSTDLLRIPRDQRELVQILNHNWASFFDNVSVLPDWISDELCVACTGGGFSKRELYSDDDDVIYNFRRLILLTGINIMATKPDLLDRAILIESQEIDDEQRKTEEEIYTDFEKIRPRLLGAIFTTLALALRDIDSYRLAALPRMADFAQWGYATAEALTITTTITPKNAGEVFLKNYKENIVLQRKEAVASSPVASAIVECMKNRQQWKGTLSRLLQILDGAAMTLGISTRSSIWPKAPNALSKQINEIRANLRHFGIQVERPPRGDERNIILRKVPKKTVGCVGTVGSTTIKAPQEPLPEEARLKASEVVPCAICGCTDDTVVHPYGEGADLICERCYAAEAEAALEDEYYSTTN